MAPIDLNIPEVEFTRSRDVSIAYQTYGDGPRDLVLVPMFSNLVFPWSNADWRASTSGWRRSRA